MSAMSCALNFCTVAAAARHIESQTSGRTLLNVVMAHSVSTTPCALGSCAVAAAARRSESKTSGRALLTWP